MTLASHPVADEGLHIPAAAHDLSGFRRWAQSADFPEACRIDFLAGDMEVEMSPEDLQTHGAVKAEIAAALHQLIARPRRGHVYIDRARVSSPAAGLSVEPDVVVVLRSALANGRARYVPGREQAPGRFVEIEGAPDLVVEVVSQGSVRKDTERLPRLYAAAGIPELWLVDARGDEPELAIHALTEETYRRSPVDAAGFSASPLLAARFRLTRDVTDDGLWFYELRSAS